jgi:tRNA 2-selenouridine synthase
MDVCSFLTHSKDHILLDVRSPGEYAHAHIPTAINLPLFSDEQRTIIGTAYKQQGKQQAIKIGLDIFGPQMRKMVEKVEDIIGQLNQQSSDQSSKMQSPSVFIHCWRGGMRSSAVAWLLNLYGFHTILLHGGYKAYRNWVLDQFSKKYKLKIICGYTGSGKTKYLTSLQNDGKTIIDLEKLAAHKGSAFGHIKMPSQPSQEMFENLLAHHLHLAGENTIWLEDESQRIGHVYIPTPFWQSMITAETLTIEIDFDQRLQNIIEEYGVLDKNQLTDAIIRISKKLGGLDTKNALQHMEENNITQAFGILLKYYDRLYENANEKKKAKILNAQKS